MRTDYRNKGQKQQDSELVVSVILEKDVGGSDSDREMMQFLIMSKQKFTGYLGKMEANREKKFAN